MNRVTILFLLFFLILLNGCQKDQKQYRDTGNLKLILPFNGEWTTVWGGDTKELNYHHKSRGQKYAFDFIITDESGKSYKNDGKRNEDYYAFGKELIAPCDGEVAVAIDGIKDNVPGRKNKLYVPGNAVILKCGKGKYYFLAHLKNGSVKVKQGQNVKQGQVVGLCGNSGNASEPHLHFHLQDREDMIKAVGKKCFFDKIRVNGQVKKNHSPIKGEKVTN